jgi:carboxymethylenebutenolidase
MTRWAIPPLAAAVGAVSLGLLLASCMSAPTAPASAVAPAIAESTITVATADGAAEALLFVPQGAGKWPAVIVWSDLAGLRPTFAGIGRRLAAQGYVVLVPNIFYRTAKIDGRVAPAPLTAEQARERSTGWMDSIGDDGGEADAKAYLAFLDARPEVDTARKAGVLGYQYGAPYAFHTAFALPERIGAVAVVHPMRIATARDNSPHLAVGRSKAAYYVALAGPDDAREPADKEDLRRAFAEAGLAGAVEVLPAGNGFAVSDAAAYDQASAEAAWQRVAALFRERLR